MSRLDSPVSGRRRYRLKYLGLVAAGALAVMVMALVIPLAQEARWTHACTKLGGQLQRSTEDVEPLVTARTVYRCYGRNGQLLDEW